ncbi:MAG: formate dehydrogenase accessory sulfurtransferase FdhD [Marmoricola sp.]
MGRLTTRRRVTRLRGDRETERIDTLVVEEPLEIRVNGTPVTVTMRTPGDDFDLAVGFLVGEGVLRATDDVYEIRYCAGATVDGLNTYNVVDVLAPGVSLPASLERNFATTSSCGVCGKASLDSVRTRSSWSIEDDALRIDRRVVVSLPDRLREAQRVFESTGGLHAAGLFTAEGDLIVAREDIGRHNAVDKVIGDAYRHHRIPLRHTVLLVSSRASFELVQKAVMAGIPMLAAVSAPSSLAVELAAESGLTLIGFVRGDSMNVYCGEQRVGRVGATSR